MGRMPAMPSDGRRKLRTRLAAAEAAVRSGHQVGRVLPTPEHGLLVVANDVSHSKRPASLQGGPLCAGTCSLGLPNAAGTEVHVPQAALNVRQAAACLGV